MRRMTLDVCHRLYVSVCFAVLLVLLLFLPRPAEACTSAAVAPRAAGGRAVLWKNRDSSFRHNEVVSRRDGKYLYVGVVNGGDVVGREIWMGVNERGLALINTASDDLARPGLPRDGEGRLLKVLLQSCATIEEVRDLLELTDAGGRDVNTQLGAIDAGGNALFFEVGQRHHAEYDAHATETGYLIRTNHALTAKPNTGWGYIRMARARELFAARYDEGVPLDARFILTGPSLDLANAVTGVFPRRQMTSTGFVDVRDTINRSSSVSVAVFESRVADEPSYATTMWVALGQPIASLAVPVWPVDQDLPSQLGGRQGSRLEQLSEGLRRSVYPLSHGSLGHYMDARKALRLRALLDPAQERIFEMVRVERQNLGPKPSAVGLASITARAVDMAEAALANALEQLSGSS